MRWIVLGLLATLVATPAPAQEVQRFVGRDRKTKVVTPDQRLPVANGPNSDAAAALTSAEAHNSTSGSPVLVPTVFYSVTVTLASGEGPGRVLIWDRTTVPADGALVGADRPMRCFYVDAGNRTTVFASASGTGMATGISWAFSTGADCQTLTRATADFVALSFKAAGQ